MVIVKVSDSDSFILLFREWCLFTLGVFTIYTGGNIGSKLTNNLTEKKEDCGDSEEEFPKEEFPKEEY